MISKLSSMITPGRIGACIVWAGLGTAGAPFIVEKIVMTRVSAEVHELSDTTCAASMELIQLGREIAQLKAQSQDTTALATKKDAAAEKRINGYADLLRTKLSTNRDMLSKYDLLEPIDRGIACALVVQEEQAPKSQDI